VFPHYFLIFLLIPHQFGILNILLHLCISQRKLFQSIYHEKKNNIKREEREGGKKREERNEKGEKERVGRYWDATLLFSFLPSPFSFT
jgi:hypothetical protein